MNTRDLANKIHDLMIVREDDGSYNLFGKYVVTPSDGLYKVNMLYDTKFGVFSSLKHAVTWCVFEKNYKFKEIKQLQELDDMIGALEVSIQLHNNLVKKSQDPELKSIYLAKLIEDKRKKRIISKQLNEFIDFSKFLQRKKYQENGSK